MYALTGTPGTGKSACASVLMDMGYRILELNEVVFRKGFNTEYDSSRDSWSVNIPALREAVSSMDADVLVGHLAHLMDVDGAVVLRCRPDVLYERLSSRGWKPEKLAENCEAEALDYITVEAVEVLGEGNVYEVDTTNLTAEEAAQEVVRGLTALPGGGRVGTVDWSDFLPWRNPDGTA